MTWNLGQVHKLAAEMKVVAFSDYRAHSLGAPTTFFERLTLKPDIILYAGDDVDRFLPPEEGLAAVLNNEQKQ